MNFPKLRSELRIVFFVIAAILILLFVANLIWG